MAKQYELTYTVSENLTPEEANGLLEKMISHFPQSNKGAGKGYNFFTLEFYAEPEMIEDLEKKLKSEPKIKKYMIVKKEEERVVKTRIRKLPIKTPLPEQKVEKIELNEIDKKLKEIFGE